VRPGLFLIAGVAILCAAATFAATINRATAASGASIAQVKFRGQVTANFTVSAKDSAGPLDARSTTRITYSAPMLFTSRPDRSYLSLVTPDAAPSGLYAVDIAGTDSDGCVFEYRKQLRAPMKLSVLAEARVTPRRVVSRNVWSNYFLDISAYPLGGTPAFPSVCGSLGKEITLGAPLRDILGSAFVFNTAETMLAGSWRFVWNRTSWPFAPVGYLQLWPKKPPLRGGTYRVPAPMDALAMGRGFTIARSLTVKRQLAGKPSVAVATVGRITFAFRRVNSG
jgi:hypothetical protein